MVRKNVILSDKQVEFFKNNNEFNMSEHIRRALDEYMNRLSSTKVSSSQSIINNKTK